MNIRLNLRNALFRFLFPPKAQYEAGQRYSPRRSYLTGWVQDARFDADVATRLEIVRKARYFERNSAIVNRLADLFECYTVGANGLAFVPTSENQEWNKAASAWFDGWCKYPDIKTLQNFATIQSLVARTWAIDGEIFIQKTRGRERKDGRSYPRIQLIETHRVASPPGAGSNIVDGVQVDDNGRPTHYWVRQGDAWVGENYVQIPADMIIHVGEPSRAGMYRPLPLLYPVLNDLHDLDDLQMLTNDVARSAASVTEIIKTKSGELDEDEYRRARMELDIDAVEGTDGTSGGSSQTREQYYEDIFQARAKVLQHDDVYEQFKSERPSVAEKEYWDYLASKVCAGFGISKLLVFPHSVQGTVTRADLSTTNAFFRSRSAVLGGKFAEVWEYVIEWGTRNVAELTEPPKDWKSLKVRPPRSVDVDVGRNSSALVAEYEAGWRTLEEICGELGADYRTVLRQRGKERAEARAVEEEFKLQPGSLIKAVTEAMKSAQPKPGTEEPEEKPELEEATT